jgi:hypothetical protein
VTEADRRIASREDSFLPFEIEGREPGNDFIENLSVHGAYVRTIDPAALHTRLKITIVAPKTRRKFAFDAEVMRVVQPEESVAARMSPGMGISFIDLGTGDPRPKAVALLQEMAALEEASKDRKIEPADATPVEATPAEAAQKKPARSGDEADAVSRLEQFLARARTQNLYEILGVDAAGATAVTVKKHYHRRSKEFHPDRFHRMRTPEIDAKVEELYGLLTKAYETLRDPVKREAYDKQHGIRQSVEFRRAAARARFDDALAQLGKKRLFAATIGFKVALSLDPGNTDIQRKLEEVERSQKFFTT